MRLIPRNRNGRDRVGAILVCVLVCLGVSLSLMTVTIRSSLAQRRQMAREVQMEQTRWLLDAGLHRGLAKVRSSESYSGESWDVGDALGESAIGVVEISVVRSDESPVQLSARATIQHPGETSSPTRRSQTWLIRNLPTSTPSSP